MSLPMYLDSTAYLSDEDNDLVTLTDEELFSWWTVWFTAAQASNDDDVDIYSHGVLAVTPGREELLEFFQYGT